MMAGSKILFKYTIVCALVFCIAAAGSAVNITEVQADPDPLWVGDTVDVQAQCATDANETLTDAYMYVTGPRNEGPITPEQAVNGSNASVSVRYDVPATGEYTANVTCETEKGNETTTASSTTVFTGQELNLTEVTVTDTPLFTDKKFRATFNLVVTDGEQRREIDDPKALVDVTGSALTTEDLYYADGAWTLVADHSLAEGDRTVALQATVKNSAGNPHTTSAQVPVTVRRPLSVAFTQAPDVVVPGTEIDLELAAQYRGEPVDMTNVTLNELAIGGMAVNQYRRDGGAVRAAVPETLDHADQIQADIAYNGETSTATVTVDTAYRVAGSLVNVDGRRLTGRLFLHDARGSVMDKDVFNNGEYRVQVPGGTYDIRITGVDRIAEVRLNGVNVTETVDDAIRIDNPEKPMVDGIETFGGMGIETAVPFTKATVQLQYDPRDVKAEQDLQLFHCAQYNFDSRHCFGTWTPIQSEMDTVQNFLEGQITESGGLVMGRLNELKLVADPDTDHNIDAKFTLRGAIRDRDNNPVQGATVTATLGDTTVTGTTGEHGSFEIALRTPEAEGEYELALEAEKPLYHNDRKTFTVDVVADRSLELTLPDEMNVAEGTEQQFQAAVENTGQVPLTDLQVAASARCSDCSLTHDPHRIDRLDVGAPQPITLTFDAGDVTAGDNVVGSFTVNSSETTAEQSFMIGVTPAVDTTEDDTNTEGNTTTGGTGNVARFALPDVSGAVGALSPPSISVVEVLPTDSPLGLINVLSVILAVGVLTYFKATDYRNGSTSSTNQRHRLHRLKEEAMDAVAVDMEDGPVETFTADRGDREQDNEQPWSNLYGGDQGGSGSTADDPDGSTSAANRQDETDSGKTEEDGSARDESDEYACDRCDDTFTSETGLTVHKVNAHGE